jgi:hypothetical protein
MAKGWMSIRNPAKSGFPTGRSGRGFGQGGFMRAGLYARVSTHDQQTLPLQLAAMSPEASIQFALTALLALIKQVGVRDTDRRDYLEQAIREMRDDGKISEVNSSRNAHDPENSQRGRI